MRTSREGKGGRIVTVREKQGRNALLGLVHEASKVVLDSGCGCGLRASLSGACHRLQLRARASPSARRRARLSGPPPGCAACTPCGGAGTRNSPPGSGRTLARGCSSCAARQQEPHTSDTSTLVRRYTRIHPPTPPAAAAPSPPRPASRSLLALPRSPAARPIAPTPPRRTHHAVREVEEESVAAALRATQPEPGRHRTLQSRLRMHERTAAAEHYRPYTSPSSTTITIRGYTFESIWRWSGQRQQH
jgi:hypothetical protein